MNGRITDTREQIDRKTCRSICDAVGERLQQNLRTESLRLSSQLEHLMDAGGTTRAANGRRTRTIFFGIRAPRKRYFSHKRVAFDGGSGDNAACFQSQKYRSGSPDGF